MPPTVRAEIVDIRPDIPKDTDRFLVDTNAWYWLFYARASQAPNAPESYQVADYPTYVKEAIEANASLHCYALTFAELAHNIEKAEREICADQANRPIPTKEFRHEYPNQHRRVMSLITDTWADVSGVSKLVDMALDTAFMQSALSRFPAVALDGYDLFMVEAALQSGLTQIITDDGDYATVAGLTVFTANERVLGAARAAGKLVIR
jgi:hypothetical protein